MDEVKRISDLITYSQDGEDIEVILEDESVWASQKSIADIFGADIKDISRHLDNIFSEGELDKEISFRNIQGSSSLNPVQYYSLDSIISVGYRVNSKKATLFRVWATDVLKQYIKDGFVINEDLLRSDPKKLNELAAKLRELRANEKNVYAAVRECFRLAASDYEPSSQEVRSFYALLQDKFHHAITQMTSAKLVLDRANHSEENMGLITIKGNIPTKEEAKNGKNYLDQTEIYRMHLLSEQFLLFAESTAMMGKDMTMSGLHGQLDNLLRLNGYPVFGGYEDYIRPRAIEHALNEYAAFIEIKKLEHIGVKVDLELFYQGEYTEYKEQTSKVTTRQLNKVLTIQ